MLKVNPACSAASASSSSGMGRSNSVCCELPLAALLSHRCGTARRWCTGGQPVLLRLLKMWRQISQSLTSRGEAFISCILSSLHFRHWSTTMVNTSRLYWVPYEGQFWSLMAADDGQSAIRKTMQKFLKHEQRETEIELFRDLFLEDSINFRSIWFECTLHLVACPNVM